jgi:hypothetical protein
MVSSRNDFHTKLSHYEQLVGKNPTHTRPWLQGLARACKPLGQAKSPLRPLPLAWLGLAYMGLALRASGLQAGPEHHYWPRIIILMRNMTKSVSDDILWPWSPKLLKGMSDYGTNLPGPGRWDRHDYEAMQEYQRGWWLVPISPSFVCISIFY